MSVNADENLHSADWLRSVFVNELALPHVRSQQGQCVQQRRRIMKDTLERKTLHIVITHANTSNGIKIPTFLKKVGG